MAEQQLRREPLSSDSQNEHLHFNDPDRMSGNKRGCGEYHDHQPYGGLCRHRSYTIAIIFRLSVGQRDTSVRHFASKYIIILVIDVCGYWKPDPELII